MSYLPISTKQKSRGPSIKVKCSICEKGIKSIELADHAPNKGFSWEVVEEGHSPLVVSLIERWVDGYCKKRQPDVLLPVVMQGLPPYTTQVLSILRELPFGVTLTYQALAEVTGNPKGARAVGNACSRNPFPLIIPCHRVLHAGNGLGGFSCGLEIKKALLAFEGSAYN
jgi:methylated-DNA-[protein]-cysteine S-methyltransferase